LKPYKKSDFAEKDLLWLAGSLENSSLVKEGKEIFKYVAAQYESREASKKYAMVVFAIILALFTSCLIGSMQPHGYYSQQIRASIKTRLPMSRSLE